MAVFRFVRMVVLTVVLAGRRMLKGRSMSLRRRMRWTIGLERVVGWVKDVLGSILSCGYVILLMIDLYILANRPGRASRLLVLGMPRGHSMGRLTAV